MDENEELYRGIVDVAWKTIKEGYEESREVYPDLVFNSEKFEEFSVLFRKKYEDIMARFMKKNTEALDAHKQAAILTICCLELNVIQHNLQDADQISIVPQLIAINVGLSYMRNCINDILKKKKIHKKIDNYYLPIAIACDTPYQEIICRILYYEQNEEDMSFNVLELSDRYFLLEYINLLQRGIEPHLLKG